ncbi:hypothetical protein DLM75_23250, partial [Leptospira stimsonii]
MFCDLGFILLFPASFGSRVKELIQPHSLRIAVFPTSLEATHFAFAVRWLFRSLRIAVFPTSLEATH